MVPLAAREREASRLADPVAETLRDTSPLGVSEISDVSLCCAVATGDAETEGEGMTEGDIVPSIERVALESADGVGVVETVAVTDTVPRPTDWDKELDAVTELIVLKVIVPEALGERLTLPHSEMREEPDGDIVELDDAGALRDPDGEAVSDTKVDAVRDAPSVSEPVADAHAVIDKVSMVVVVADPAEERLADTDARAERVPTATDVVARPDTEPDPEIEGLCEGLDDARELALFFGVRLSLTLGVDVEDTKGDCDGESEPLSVRVPSAIVAVIETVR